MKTQSAVSHNGCHFGRAQRYGLDSRTAQMWLRLQIHVCLRFVCLIFPSLLRFNATKPFSSNKRATAILLTTSLPNIITMQARERRRKWRKSGRLRLGNLKYVKRRRPPMTTAVTKRRKALERKKESLRGSTPGFIKILQTRRC